MPEQFDGVAEVGGGLPVGVFRNRQPHGSEAECGDPEAGFAEVVVNHGIFPFPVFDGLHVV